MTLELKVIPPIQFIISSGLMYVLATYNSQFNFEFYYRTAGLLIIIITASIIGILALYDFHKHQTTFHPHTPEKTSALVDTGVFAYSRNPMYVALTLALFAFAMYLQNYTCFLVIPLFIGYITRFQIIPEERMLDKLFANEYQAYCKKVNRWL